MVCGGWWRLLSDLASRHRVQKRTGRPTLPSLAVSLGSRHAAHTGWCRCHHRLCPRVQYATQRRLDGVCSTQQLRSALVLVHRGILVECRLATAIPGVEAVEGFAGRKQMRSDLIGCVLREGYAAPTRPAGDFVQLVVGRFVCGCVVVHASKFRARHRSATATSVRTQRPCLCWPAHKINRRYCVTGVILLDSPP